MGEKLATRRAGEGAKRSRYEKKKLFHLTTWQNRAVLGIQILGSGSALGSEHVGNGERVPINGASDPQKKGNRGKTRCGGKASKGRA